MFKRYSGDPYWTMARYSGKCAGCGKPFPALSRVFRYSNGSMHAEACGCGDHAARDFEAGAMDEALMSGT